MGVRDRSTVLLAGALLLAVVQACTSSVAEEPPDHRPVVWRGEFRRELLLTGELRPARTAAVSAPQTSVFQMSIKFMAAEGSSVQAGDLLLELDGRALADRLLDLEVAIATVDVQLLTRRNELESRRKDLEIEMVEKQHVIDRAALAASVSTDILSRREHAQRQADLQKARASLVEVEGRLEMTREQGESELEVLSTRRRAYAQEHRIAVGELELLSIRAPVDGLVLRASREGADTPFREGDACWPGQTVLQVWDLEAMQVVLAVSEVDMLLLRPGMPVDLIPDALPHRRLAGRIERIPMLSAAPRPGSGVRVFEVMVSLTSPPTADLRAGMSVRGLLLVDRRPDAVLVNRESVGHDGESYWLLGLGPGSGSPIHPVARNARHYVLDETLDGAAVQALLLDGGRGPVVAADEGLSAPGDEPPAPLPAEPAGTGGGSGTITVSGLLQPGTRVDLGPPSVRDFLGHTLTWLVPEGTTVQPGDVVARFDTAALEARVQALEESMETDRGQEEQEQANRQVWLQQLRLDLAHAQAQVEEAELQAAVPEAMLPARDAELLRLQAALARRRATLLREKVELQEDLVRRKLELLAAAQEYAGRKADYYASVRDQFDVRSPLAGVAIHLQGADGEPRGVGESIWILDKVVRVAGEQALTVQAQIGEVEAAGIVSGQPAEVRVHGLPGTTLQGRVHSVGRVVRRQANTGKVLDILVALTGEVPATVRPGMGVSVTIHLGPSLAADEEAT